MSLRKKESGVCRKDKISAVFRWQTDPPCLHNVDKKNQTKKKEKKQITHARAA